MPYISSEQYKEYKELVRLKNNGQLLTPSGLRLICDSCDNKPEKIGKMILESLIKLGV